MLETLLLILPAELPLWAGSFVLVALAYTAYVDARTGLVPPIPLALASLLVMSSLILQSSDRALTAPLYALIFYLAIFAINELHFYFTKRDALGMGDAHWSLVVVLAYGVPTALAAWGAGAWLALAWLGLRRAASKPAQQVYFVPFLMLSLIGFRLFSGH